MSPCPNKCYARALERTNQIDFSSNLNGILELRMAVPQHALIALGEPVVAAATSALAVLDGAVDDVCRAEEKG